MILLPVNVKRLFCFWGVDRRIYQSKITWESRVTFLVPLSILVQCESFIVDLCHAFQWSIVSSCSLNHVSGNDLRLAQMLIFFSVFHFVDILELTCLFYLRRTDGRWGRGENIGKTNIVLLFMFGLNYNFSVWFLNFQEVCLTGSEALILCLIC